MSNHKPHKITLRQVPAMWRVREPFDANGTLRGITDRPGTLGQLPPEWREQYMKEETAGNIAFTVLSYSTPIAWVLRSGEEIKPPVKYSVTTSKHQGRLY